MDFNQILSNHAKNQLFIHSMESRIFIRDNSTGRQILEDGFFRCAHDRLTISKPCCGGFDKYGRQDCGCGGGYSVYCEDCNNSEMTREQAETILEGVEDDRQD